MDATAINDQRLKRSLFSTLIGPKTSIWSSRTSFMEHKIFPPRHRKGVMTTSLRLALALFVIVLSALCLLLSSSPYLALWNSHQDCGTPSDERCFQEMLQGSPSWNDPRLLQVVREDFLWAPEALPPEGPEEGPVSHEDAEILEAIREEVGEVRFVVAVSGVAPGLAERARGGGGGSGLWVDPRPEDEPRRSPLPRLWYSHACLASSVPHLNGRGHQCFGLASLLLALGRPPVDLVLGHAVEPTRVLTSLLDEYDRPVKAVLVRNREPLSLLLEKYNDRVASLRKIGNNTLILIRN